MPDLFLGAAAGPPGLPDWIDHAFPDPVKNDLAYLEDNRSTYPDPDTGPKSEPFHVLHPPWRDRSGFRLVQPPPR